MIPDDYSQFLTWEQVSANSARLGSIVPMLAKEYFLSVRFGFPGLLLARRRSLLLPRRTAAARRCCRSATWCCSRSIYCGPYLVLPEEEWRKTYTWSAGRLTLQLVPMVFLAAALLVLPRARGRQEIAASPDVMQAKPPESA